MPTNTDLLLMAMGVGVLFIKDLLDEFFPGRCQLLENKRAAVRWVTACVTMVIIVMCGVFSADQFIYAQF